MKKIEKEYMFNQFLHTLIKNDPDLLKLSRNFSSFNIYFPERNLKTWLLDGV